MSEGRAGQEEGVAYRGGREFRGLPCDAGALRGVKQTRLLGYKKSIAGRLHWATAGAGQRALTR